MLRRCCSGPCSPSSLASSSSSSSTQPPIITCSTAHATATNRACYQVCDADLDAYALGAVSACMLPASRSHAGAALLKPSGSGCVQVALCSCSRHTRTVDSSRAVRKPRGATAACSGICLPGESADCACSANARVLLHCTVVLWTFVVVAVQCCDRDHDAAVAALKRCLL